MESSHTEEDDKKDMEELAAGHDSAMNPIMRRWKDRLTGFLYRMVGNHSSACDLAQETFVRVYRHRHSYNPRHAFSTWLFSIAANLARNHHRWRKRHPEALLEPAEMAESSPADPGADPHTQAANRERLNAVETAISRLPREQREALVLSVYEGMSHEQIADITDSSVKAVELRIYRARRELRHLLAQHL